MKRIEKSNENGIYEKEHNVSMWIRQFVPGIAAFESRNMHRSRVIRLYTGNSK